MIPWSQALVVYRHAVIECFGIGDDPPRVPGRTQELPLHVVYAGQRLLPVRVTVFIDFAVAYLTKEMAVLRECRQMSYNLIRARRQREPRNPARTSIIWWRTQGMRQSRGIPMSRNRPSGSKEF